MGYSPWGHKELDKLSNWHFHFHLDTKEIKPINPKGNQPWIFIGSEVNVTQSCLWLTDWLQQSLR